MSSDLIREILLNNTSVFSHIGFTWGTNNKEIRCFRSSAPMGTAAPYIVYHDVGGVDGNPVGKSLKFRVLSWASDELSSKALANDVETALKNFAGKSGDTWIDGFVLDFFSDSHEEKETGLWYSIRTFTMIYGVN